MNDRMIINIFRHSVMNSAIYSVKSVIANCDPSSKEVWNKLLTRIVKFKKKSVNEFDETEPIEIIKMMLKCIDKTNDEHSLGLQAIIDNVIVSVDNIRLVGGLLNATDTDYENE